MDARTSAVLELVDDRAGGMLALLAELVAIPSVGGTDAENEIVARLAAVFAGMGLDVDHWRVPLDELRARDDFPGVEVERREAWGLVGRLPGTGGAGSLMFDGHVDVVPPGDLGQWSTPPFEPIVRDGRMYGRGTCDMKAGLVAAIWALDSIRRAGVRLAGDVVLAAVVGEEDGGLGTFATLARGWTADDCVIPEPTDLDLVPANAGSLTFRLRVRGHATHAARRTEGVSSVDKLVPVLAAVHALEARRNADPDASTRWPIPYPISVGTVHGGDWASSVPDLVVAEGRLGVALDEPVGDARRAFEQAMSEVSAADPWLAAHPVEVEWWGGQFASGRNPPGNDLVDAVGRAHAAVGGAAQSVWTAPYGSDLRLLTGLGGVPTLQYGPGDVALAHGPNESVVLDDVRTTARTLAVLAMDRCDRR